MYSSITQLISAHPTLWRYNYDPDHVPKLPVAAFKEIVTDKLPELCGPLEVDGQGSSGRIADYLYAQTVALYPRETEGYNVVCDQYCITAMGNRIVFALADGCGWGRRPREAAIRAARTVIEQVADRTVQVKMSDSIEIRNALLRSFNVAHEKIMEGKEEFWMAGATTLAAGQIIEIDSESDEWAVIAVCVGDCKILVWNSGTKTVVDLTAGNRLHARNAKDAGGSLGAQKDSALPDLRNLGSYFWPLSRGDIVLAVSDGVYDNADPECLGMTIEEALTAVGSRAGALIQKLSTLGSLDSVKWTQLDNATVEAIKSVYMLWRISSLISKAMEVQGDRGLPETLAAALIANSSEVTKKTRDLMEADPSRPEPADHRTHPGKMDHTSVVAIMATEWAGPGPVRTARSGGSVAPTREIPSSMDDEGAHPETERIWDSEAGPLEIAGATLPTVDPVQVMPFDLAYTRVLNGLKGAQAGSESKLGNVAAGGSVSTYPSLATPEDPSLKLGDPILTHYVAELTPSRTLTAISSGLHWGKPSAVASKKALTAACDTIAALHLKIGSTRDVKKALLKALDAAHASASEDPESDHTVVMALAIATQTTAGAWLLNSISIGFCKIFLWLPGMKRVLDITGGNAPLSRSDPGGRLGPFRNNQPDTTNLLFNVTAVSEGGS